MEDAAGEDQWKIVKQRSGLGKSLIWRAGKKIVITGIVLSSAPFVLPPLIVGTSIGFALSVPFGMLFVGYACTQKVMSMLLSEPSVEVIQEEEREVEEEEFEEDVKRRLEMRVELVEDDGTGKVNQIGGGVEEEPVSGVHDEEEVEALPGHGITTGSEKGAVEKETRDEGNVVEEPLGGVDEQEAQDHHGHDITRVSDEGMDNEHGSMGRRGYEEDCNVKEDNNTGEIVEDKRDEGVVADESGRGNNDEQKVENERGSIASDSEDVKGVMDESTERKDNGEDYHVVEDEKLRNADGLVNEDVKRDKEILIGEGNSDDEEAENELGGGVARGSEEGKDGMDKGIEERGDEEEDHNVKEGKDGMDEGIEERGDEEEDHNVKEGKDGMDKGIEERGDEEEDHNVKEDERLANVNEEEKSDEGTVAEEPVRENNDEPEVEQHGIARSSEEGMENMDEDTEVVDTEGSLEEEKRDEGIVEKEPVGGTEEGMENMDEDMEVVDTKEAVQEEKRDEGIVEKEPVGGNEEGMENRDEDTEVVDTKGAVEEENTDKGIVVKEPVGGTEEGMATMDEDTEVVDAKEAVDEEKRDDGIVVKEPVGGTDDEHEADHKQLVEKDEITEKRGKEEDDNEKIDERVVVGGSIGGADKEQKMENQPENNITRGSEEGQGNGDVATKGEEDEKLVDAKKRKKYQKKKDRKKKRREEGTVVGEPIRGINDEQEVESQPGNGITMDSKEGMENKEEFVEENDKPEDVKATKEKSREKKDAGVVVKEPIVTVDVEEEEKLGKEVRDETTEEKEKPMVEDEPMEETKGVTQEYGAMEKAMEEKEMEQKASPVKTTEEKEKPMVEDESMEKTKGVTQEYGGMEKPELQKKNAEETEGGKDVKIPEETININRVGEGETKLDLSSGEWKSKEEAPTQEKVVFVEGSRNDVKDVISRENGCKQNGGFNEELDDTEMEGVVEGKKDDNMKDSVVVKEMQLVETPNRQVNKEIPIVEVISIKENPIEIADESEPNLSDEETRKSQGQISETDETSEDKLPHVSETDETSEDELPQAYVSRPVEIDAESQHESMAVSSITDEEHDSDMGEECVDSAVPQTEAASSTLEMQTEIPSEEVLYQEEELWGRIDSMRKILGYKGMKQSTFYEEIKALYIFTGVEPPAPFKEPVDLGEVDDKLRLLMAIVGVKC